MHPESRCNAFPFGPPTPSNTGFGTLQGLKCNTYVGEGREEGTMGSLPQALAPEVYHRLC